MTLVQTTATLHSMPALPSTDAGQRASLPIGAEQRVLGALAGIPDWSEVMDMASGQVYFWNSSTNEVAWEPPEGSMPRSGSLVSYNYVQKKITNFQTDSSTDPSLRWAGRTRRHVAFTRPANPTARPQLHLWRHWKQNLSCPGWQREEKLFLVACPLPSEAGSLQTCRLCKGSGSKPSYGSWTGKLSARCAPCWALVFLSSMPDPEESDEAETDLQDASEASCREYFREQLERMEAAAEAALASSASLEVLPQAVSMPAAALDSSSPEGASPPPMPAERGTEELSDDMELDSPRADGSAAAAAAGPALEEGEVVADGSVSKRPKHFQLELVKKKMKIWLEVC